MLFWTPILEYIKIRHPQFRNYPLMPQICSGLSSETRHAQCIQPERASFNALWSDYRDWTIVWLKHELDPCCQAISFSCPLACCLLLKFFLILFLSFPETNLGSAEAEKASVKEGGGLLTACAYEAITLWTVSMFLKY